MNPQEALLEQLRDIHAAPEVPWWPPAPGWWLLAAILLVALAWLARRLLARYRAHQRRQRLLHFIEWVETEVDPVEAPGQYLADHNRIFKLVALRAFPDADCAQMAGDEWVGFLRSHLGGGEELEPLAALAEGPYRPAAEFDPAELSRLLRRWVDRHG